MADGDKSGGVEAEKAVRITRIGSVLEVVLAHPPVNALGVAVRRGLANALDLAEADNSRAVVIRGEGGLFSAGADIGEVGQDARGVPRLGALCRRIEMLDKPVVAMLSGVALGGGLELALAAHLRLADATARLALPEVLLGLLPGAGGTQRLPRLVGAVAALDLMLTGRVIGVTEALELGLVDRLVTMDASEAARAAARDLAEAGGWRRSCDLRDGFADLRGYREAVAAARARLVAERVPAPRRIVDCVEAALLLPFEQGLAFETAGFDDLRESEESAGLRWAFRAERAARKLPAAVAGVAAGPVTRIAVWGAADEAVEIARQGLKAGLAVQLADPSAEVLAAAMDRIAAAQEAEVAAGRMAPEARDADRARLTAVVGAQRLAEAEAVVTLRGDLVLAAPRTVLAVGLSGETPAPVTAVRGALAVALVPGAQMLAEMVLEGPDVTPVRAAQGAALARRLGWDVVPVGPGAGGPVAVALATALAEAVALLEGRGMARAAVAQALALAGIAGVGQPGVAGRTEEAVARRCFAAMANAGARLMEAGVARDAATVDAVAVSAGIVARWTGGPMHQADRRGLMVLRRDLRIWANEAPALYAPSPLFDRFIGAERKLTG